MTGKITGIINFFQIDKTDIFESSMYLIPVYLFIVDNLSVSCSPFLSIVLCSLSLSQVHTFMGGAYQST